MLALCPGLLRRKKNNFRNLRWNLICTAATCPNANAPEWLAVKALWWRLLVVLQAWQIQSCFLLIHFCSDLAFSRKGEMRNKMYSNVRSKIKKKEKHLKWQELWTKRRGMNKKSGEKILEEHFFIKEILGFVNPEIEIPFPYPLKFCHKGSQDFPHQLLGDRFLTIYSRVWSTADLLRWFKCLSQSLEALGCLTRLG